MPFERWTHGRRARVVAVALAIVVALEAWALSPVLRSRVVLAAYKQEVCHTADGADGADIVMVGDSLTMMGEPWERHLRRWPCRVVALGHTGYSIAQLRPYALQAIAAHPRLIVLTAGTNDIRLNHDLAIAASQFLALVDLIRPRTELIVTLPPPIADADQTRAIHRLHALLRPALARRHVAVITLDALEAGGKLASRYSLDGVHLTSAGYAVWSAKLRPLL